MMQKIVEELIKKNKTIAVMESCTGGGVTNAITNIEGASKVISFSAVTYSNEYKIKMGVSKEIIEKYTVYSKQTAQSMAEAISIFTNSNYGIGITGKLNRADENNIGGADNVIYFSIYDKDQNCYYDQTITIDAISRSKAKELIIQTIIKTLEKYV